MLWRMPADTHEQRIGIMSTTQAFFAHRRPTTSVSATKVFPGGLRPPAIAKSLAETAETAEMGAVGRCDARPWEDASTAQRARWSDDACGRLLLYAREPGAVPSRP